MKFFIVVVLHVQYLIEIIGELHLLERKILKNKPLVEAIFELKWDIQQFENGIDPHYRILPGSLFEKVRSQYPYHEPLPTATMPDAVCVYIIQHRFRKNKDTWPLIQIGQGILTLNDTECYVWEDFEQRIASLLDSFIEVYPEKDKLQFTEVTLRYIDGVQFNHQKEDVFSFLDKDMKLKVQFHEDLLRETGIGKSPSGYDLRFDYPMDDLKGIAHARFRKGKLHNEDALIWETTTQSKDKSVLRGKEEIKIWLKKAHEFTAKWFFNMIEGDLLKRFE